MNHEGRAAAEVAPAADKTIRRADYALVEPSGRPCESRNERGAQNSDKKADRVKAVDVRDGAGEAGRDGAGDENGRHGVPRAEAVDERAQGEACDESSQ